MALKVPVLRTLLAQRGSGGGCCRKHLKSRSGNADDRTNASHRGLHRCSRARGMCRLVCEIRSNCATVCRRLSDATLTLRCLTSSPDHPRVHWPRWRSFVRVFGQSWVFWPTILFFGLLSVGPSRWAASWMWALALLITILPTLSGDGHGRAGPHERRTAGPASPARERTAPPDHPRSRAAVPDRWFATGGVATVSVARGLGVAGLKSARASRAVRRFRCTELAAPRRRPRPHDTSDRPDTADGPLQLRSVQCKDERVEYVEIGHGDSQYRRVSGQASALHARSKWLHRWAPARSSTVPPSASVSRSEAWSGPAATSSGAGIDHGPSNVVGGCTPRVSGSRTTTLVLVTATT